MLTKCVIASEFWSLEWVNFWFSFVCLFPDLLWSRVMYMKKYTVIAKPFNFSSVLKQFTPVLNSTLLRKAIKWEPQRSFHSDTFAFERYEKEKRKIRNLGNNVIYLFITRSGAFGIQVLNKTKTKCQVGLAKFPPAH